MAEEPETAVELTGGRMTSRVVRVNDSVRRPATAASHFVAALLQRFEQQGFMGAPRYLRQDGNTDIYSYIPGDVPSRFQVWEDSQIVAAGRLLRSLHDATRGCDLAGASPVVCHHDVAPNNAVFQDGVPTAWIDFDAAAPGNPLEDVGYASWTWCIASKQTQPVNRQVEQVRILADAYGLDTTERSLLMDAVLEQQIRNARFWADIQLSGNAPADTAVIADRIEWSGREAAFTARHRTVFEAALV